MELVSELYRLIMAILIMQDSGSMLGFIGHYSGTDIHAASCEKVPKVLSYYMKQTL